MKILTGIGIGLILLFSSNPTKAQSTCDSSFVFTIVEKMPFITNSEKELTELVNQEIATLTSKKDNGLFYAFCTINCKDELVNVEIKNNQTSLSDSILQEAIMKHVKWGAGKHREKKVDCHYILRFKLKKGKLKLLNYPNWK